MSSTVLEDPSSLPADRDWCTELLHQVGAGDRDAFATLYDRLSPSIFAIAQQQARSDRPAPVLAEAVFLRLWRFAPYFPHQEQPAGPWILGHLDAAIGEGPRLDV